MATIIKINLKEEEEWKLHQLLRILQKQADKMKDLLVVSGMKQILLDMIYAKKAVQQTKDDQNGTGTFGKGNVAANIFRQTLGLWGLAVK